MSTALQTSNKTVVGRFNEIFIFRFGGWRIAETWGVVDVFSQMKQLGLVAA